MAATDPYHSKGTMSWPMLGSDESGENGSVSFKTLTQDFLYEPSLISIIRTEIDHTLASLKTVLLHFCRVHMLILLPTVKEYLC